MSNLGALAIADFSWVLNGLLGAGAATMLLAVVAAIRRYKSGEIVDDDAVIKRLDTDNEKLRRQVADRDEIIEDERRKRWKAEDLAAEYRRRLSHHEEVK